VSFTLGTGSSAPTCTGQSDATGAASCSLTPNQAAGTYRLSASFAGDNFYQASSTTTQFTVSSEESTLQITSSATLAVGSVLVKATLLEDGQTPVVGRAVNFTAGSASGNGTTDSTGVASATLTLPPGQYTLTGGFAGDAFYQASTAPNQTLYVYQPTQFVIWGGNAGGVSAGQDYTIWGSQWDKQVTGGSYNANASFKGYAGQVNGATWSADAGNSNSSNPPDTVDTYISVLVSTNISKHGSTINGNVTELAVLRVDNPASYQPDPGATGSGVMMAVVQSRTNKLHGRRLRKTLVFFSGGLEPNSAADRDLFIQGTVPMMNHVPPPGLRLKRHNPLHNPTAAAALRRKSEPSLM
jgi:hypothetical protein